jgi:hypothetical protein
MVGSTIDDGIAQRQNMHAKAITGECYVTVSTINNQGRYLNNSRVIQITQDPSPVEDTGLPMATWSQDTFYRLSSTEFPSIKITETQIEHDLGNIYHSVAGPFATFGIAKEYAAQHLGPVYRNSINDDTSFWGEVPAPIQSVQCVLESLVKHPVASFKSGRYPSMTFEDARMFMHHFHNMDNCIPEKVRPDQLPELFGAYEDDAINRYGHSLGGHVPHIIFEHYATMHGAKPIPKASFLDVMKRNLSLGQIKQDLFKVKGVFFKEKVGPAKSPLEAAIARGLKAMTERDVAQQPLMKHILRSFERPDYQSRRVFNSLRGLSMLLEDKYQLYAGDAPLKLAAAAYAVNMREHDRDYAAPSVDFLKNMRIAYFTAAGLDHFSTSGRSYTEKFSPRTPNSAERLHRLSLQEIRSIPIVQNIASALDRPEIDVNAIMQIIDEVSEEFKSNYSIAIHGDLVDVVSEGASSNPERGMALYEIIEQRKNHNRHQMRMS